MRAERLLLVLAALGWVVSLVKGQTPDTDLESVRYRSTRDERLISDTYTEATINITYKDEIGEQFIEYPESGRYGEGFIDSFKGVAVHVRAEGPGGENDHTGCTWPLLSVAAPDESLPEEPWIAVISRGSCNFELKVQNAWRANATAVLIYNDRGTTRLEKMKLSTDNDRNISAVFTVKMVGDDIDYLIGSGKKVTVEIIQGRTFTHVTPTRKVYSSGASNNLTQNTLFSIFIIYFFIKSLV